jgi:hypothetical protein
MGASASTLTDLEWAAHVRSLRALVDAPTTDGKDGEHGAGGRAEAEPVQRDDTGSILIGTDAEAAQAEWLVGNLRGLQAQLGDGVAAFQERQRKKAEAEAVALAAEDVAAAAAAAGAASSSQAASARHLAASASAPLPRGGGAGTAALAASSAGSPQHLRSFDNILHAASPAEMASIRGDGTLRQFTDLNAALEERLRAAAGGLPGCAARRAELEATFVRLYRGASPGERATMRADAALTVAVRAALDAEDSALNASIAGLELGRGGGDGVGEGGLAAAATMRGASTPGRGGLDDTAASTPGRGGLDDTAANVSTPGGQGPAAALAGETGGRATGTPGGGRPARLPEERGWVRKVLHIDQLWIACGGGRGESKDDAPPAPRPDVAAALLSEARPAGLDLDELNASGFSAMHYACRAGSLACVKLLLGYGAGAELRTRAGRTPLQVACDGGHATVAAHLLATGVEDTVAGTEGAGSKAYAAALEEALIRRSAAAAASLAATNPTAAARLEGAAGERGSPAARTVDRSLQSVVARDR